MSKHNTRVLKHVGVFDYLCLNKGVRTRNDNNDIMSFVCCLEELLSLSEKSKGVHDFSEPLLNHFLQRQ